MTVTNRMILISGRFRSTHKKPEPSSRYKLQYRLSYDGRHVFSEQEKEEIARIHHDQNPQTGESVVSV